MIMRDRGPPSDGAQSLITRPVGRLLRWRRNTGGTQEEHRRNKVIGPPETQTQAELTIFKIIKLRNKT